MTHQHREDEMIDLTKEEREFIYAILNQVNVQGVEPNELKLSVLKKMNVENDDKKNSA